MTPEIELRFYGPLRDVVDTKSQSRTVSRDATVESVLDELVADVPDLSEYLYDDDDELLATAVVRKNNANASLDEPVEEGDTISLTVQVVGGRS